jgi:hypothetical protein
MRIRHIAATCSLALALPACTLITDAHEREVIDGPTDLEFSFSEMGVHASLPLDVAIVSEDDVLQGRARVLLPPAQDAYPEVSVSLEKALPPGNNRLFFFVDNNENNRVDSAERAIVEHIWIEDVPASGKGSFKHGINFRVFTEDDYQALNKDIVFELPALPAALRARECLAKLVDAAIEESLALHVFLGEEQREVAYFKTFKGNPLPREIRLTGVIDAPNEYRIDVILDGERRNSINLSAPLGDEPFSIPANRWFPGSAVQINACRTLVGG